LITHQIKNQLEGLKSSYTQVFFSESVWFSLIVFLSTFTDPYAGTAGLLAIIITNIMASWLGLNEGMIKSGTYSYNSLMVGLVLGVYFQFSWVFILILFLGSFLCLIITSWLGILLYKYKVPFLSLPFLITIWIMLLATRNYENLHLSERGIYTTNEMFLFGGNIYIYLNELLNSFHIPLFWDVYFKSLGAIIFQYNIVAGFLIAIGLLIYSRISFTLSLLGYTTGFLFYNFVDGSFNELIYGYIGFNFILLSIAIGGFFLIPSIKSYLIVIVCTPLTAILISAVSNLFLPMQLPIYSLPFNVIAILILFILNHRYTYKKPELVTNQLLSPEKNLYAHTNRLERFKHDTYYHISLPFWGEWTVSQGYEGSITHKEEWKYALDFVVTDENNKTYQLPGTDVSHFYCDNLPVIAPASGWIIEIKDDIDDNAIGDVNLKENWGNTVIIKHAEDLYSKLSHIKKGTFKVKVGDYVYKGDLIANCGSSGRSPEPHLHFQLQTTPHIGSHTIYYPISYYITKDKNKFQFHSFEVPKENDIISKVAINSLLKNAFHFIPGQIIKMEVEENSKKEIIKWEVFTNAYNQTYIYCHKTGATAYVYNNEVLHYFTAFYGDKASLLYQFYLGAHKIVLGYYQDMEVKDILPINCFNLNWIKFIHDFTAPFFQYIQTNYTAKFKNVDDVYFPQFIEIETKVEAQIGEKSFKKIDFNLIINNNQVKQFTISQNNKIITATCID
jgi:urea transporter/murein DD-endopeptidase MepM/ murein hydrolase activator NlpD